MGATKKYTAEELKARRDEKRRLEREALKLLNIKKGRPPLPESVKAQRKIEHSKKQADKVKKVRKESLWKNKEKFFETKKIVSLNIGIEIWEKFGEYFKNIKAHRLHGRSWTINKMIVDFLEANTSIDQEGPILVE